MGLERDFAWGNGCTMQRADEVPLSCTLEACMVLGTSAIPVISIRKSKKINKVEI